MSIIIKPEVMKYIDNLLASKLRIYVNNIITENNLNINPEIIEKYININILYKNKKKKPISLISEEYQCLAMNSSNKRCNKIKECDSKYCIKHLHKNNNDYIDDKNINKITNKTEIYRITGEIIYINGEKYIYIKNNNLLFTYDLYNIEYIDKYIV